MLYIHHFSVLLLLLLFKTHVYEYSCDYNITEYFILYK